MGPLEQVTLEPTPLSVTVTTTTPAESVSPTCACLFPQLDHIVKMPVVTFFSPLTNFPHLAVAGENTADSHCHPYE